MKRRRKGMKKNILIGSMIAVILLLLMPSIPAIQLKTIDSAAQNNIIKKFNDLDFNELIDIFNTGQKIKHPILFLIVRVIAEFRFLRSGILYKESIDWCSPHCRWVHPHNPISNPFLFIRSLMLFFTTVLWSEFWGFVSDKLGWNWVLPF